MQNLKLVKSIKEVREQVKAWKKEGLSVGLVPTMGYLHKGHASLVAKAKATCDRVIVSIFVNPTQFGEGEDLATYPRDLERDKAILEEKECDMLFAPEVSEMYDADAATFVQVENVMTSKLCGKTRPIHFKGVCTVVAKLFNIVNPDYAFFGQKDAQQLAIIKKMVVDLKYGIEIVACPIVREEDGLALSSRNTYLNEEERKAALVLSQSIELAKKKLATETDEAASIVAVMKEHIEQEPLAKVDYVEAVRLVDLEKVDKIGSGVLVAMAVYIGKTRLIDNFIVD